MLGWWGIGYCKLKFWKDGGSPPEFASVRICFVLFFILFDFLFLKQLDTVVRTRMCGGLVVEKLGLSIHTSICRLVVYSHKLPVCVYSSVYSDPISTSVSGLVLKENASVVESVRNLNAKCEVQGPACTFCS